MSQVIARSYGISSVCTQVFHTSFTNNTGNHSKTVNYKATLRVRTLHVFRIQRWLQFGLQCLLLEPFGCIIHPSVYLIMDIYARFGIELAMRRFEKDINRFRNEQHPNTRDPWVTLQTEAAPQTSVKACRILVCGRTGVGKSTLINRVFGVPMVCTKKLLSCCTRS